ncbi:Zn(II)2Cys6 transcription factor [Aspergillus homomorphus CBS 101889]|uniref:Zn(2)-C6 fungal-type domain-containing protein n=1 Tax=Aspergillus homomorphus (strain CBS 101889) TaxID=1450537 RepID=A0A395HLD5_ASPHC|nr:hypothetical protein BO97DRAFT_200666 [Aspergillus homomorphus CBS 101889]RAL08580.1 hypothetical protein BO97DRAFT_200666 [Aspergillus homomorphus CBS 101889]
MGRSSWRAQSCRTCLARKVKCDKARPTCCRCRSSNRECGGSSSTTPTHGTHTLLHPSQQLMAEYQSQTQLLAQFLHDYLPPKTRRAVTYPSPLHWAETFFTLLESGSPIVHASLAALTLTHTANTRHDDALAQQGRHQYELAVQQIRALPALTQPTDLIRSGMILALYESCTHSPGQGNAWQIHVQAACNLVRQLAAPALALSKQDLRRLRTVDFLRICIDGQIISPPNLELPAEPATDVFDRLLDILYQIMHTLAAVRRKTRLDGLNRDSAELLMRRAVVHEAQLLDWYRGLQSEDGGMVISRPAAVSREATKKNALAFSNPSVIPLMLLYWLGMVAVYASTAETLQTLAQSRQFATSTTLPQRLNKADSLCRHFANRIHQRHAGCAGLGLGTAILAAATAAAARQICASRQ